MAVDALVDPSAALSKASAGGVKADECCPPSSGIRYPDPKLEVCKP